MKSKKASQAKKVTKKTSKPVVAKKTKPIQTSKPVAKKASKPAVTPKKTVSVNSIPLNTPNKSFSKPVKMHDIPELFKDFYREGDRIFLRNPKKFAGFPDLLDLQKRGYEDFINIYINKLFGNINPIWDIA